MNSGQQAERMKEFKQLGETYKRELLNQIIPFWEKYSIDTEYGGYFTCLNDLGEVYDTDKFVWLQCRQIWMFSMLYNQVEKKPEWLILAQKGAAFMLKHGKNENGDWYFSLTREGAPLVHPYNIFSDCFAAMAFSELFKASRSEEYKKTAIQTFHRILQKQSNPKQNWNKTFPGTRNLRNFALPMILCNLSLILQQIIGSQEVDKIAKPLIKDIMENFVHPEKNIILQNIMTDNTMSDSFEGRLINPGHGNESIWFLLDLAVRYQDENLIKKCINILISNTQFGWDQQYQGIFYFIDLKGHPTQQLQWDQKLWWVHLESMISFLKAYKLTGNLKCKEWFQRIHQYTWKHFRDSKNRGQWYGYLNRKGEVLLNLKGGKWKGCFHVPRALFQLSKIIDC